MVATPFPRKKPKLRPAGPPRFVLCHLGGAAPATDLALIKAVPGLTVVVGDDRVLLVKGPKDLAALKDALPALQPSWSFANEAFYQKQKD